MAEVPDNFPFPALIATAQGIHEKFTGAQGTDGRLAPSSGDRTARYERCAELVEWAKPFLAQKLAKPKYAGLSRALAIEKLGLTMRSEFFDVSRAEVDWILARVDTAGLWRESAGE